MYVMKTPKEEPVIYSSLVPVILGAIFALLQTFGVEFTQEQQFAIIAAIIAIVPVLAYFVRKYTTPWTSDNPLVKYPEDHTSI